MVAGQTLKDVTLPMIPAPVITGKVFDPHRAPLAAALVHTCVSTLRSPMMTTRNLDDEELM